MVILLRILIIVMLLLSAAALGLGVKLFGQRETLKGRTQTLEQGVLSLTKTVEADLGESLTTKELPTMDTRVTADRLTAFTPGAASNDLNAALNELIGRARVQHDRLNETRTALADTQTTLADTEKAKQKVEGELDTEKKTVKEQEQKIAGLNEDVTKKTAAITELEGTKKTLEEQIDEQKTKIGKLEDDKADLKSAKEQVEKKLAEMMKAQMQQTAAGDTPKGIPPGLKGQVLFVNPDWNFVILGVAQDSGVAPAVDLIVQREDKLIGKLRVSEVKPDYNLAVAEILGDWRQDDLKVQEGDYVIY